MFNIPLSQSVRSPGEEYVNKYKQQNVKHALSPLLKNHRCWVTFVFDWQLFSLNVEEKIYLGVENDATKPFMQRPDLIILLPSECY